MYLHQARVNSWQPPDKIYKYQPSLIIDNLNNNYLKLSLRTDFHKLNRMVESYWDWLPIEIREKIRFHVLDLMIHSYYDDLKPTLNLIHEELLDKTFCLRYYIGELRYEIIGNIFSTPESRKWHVNHIEHNGFCTECCKQLF